MKIWSFLFCDPEQPYASARVKAPSRVEACKLLGNQLAISINPSRDIRLGPHGILITYLGESGKDDLTSEVVGLRLRPNATRELLENLKVEF